MYFIEDGSVSIRIEQDAGEVEISVLGKGQYFGELALVTHRPRAASAYAASDVKVACKYYKEKIKIRIALSKMSFFMNLNGREKRLPPIRLLLLCTFFFVQLNSL